MPIKLYLYTTITSFVKAEDGIVGYMLETVYKGEVLTLYDFKKVNANKEIAELIALVLGLLQLNIPCDIELYASTEMAYSRLNTGMLSKWNKQNWLNSVGMQIRHSVIWKCLLDTYEKKVITMEFTKTDRHTYTRWMSEYSEKHREEIEDIEMSKLEDIAGFKEGELESV